MKIIQILSIISFLSLVSCDGPNDPAPMAATKSSFENPEKVGTLQDGREVFCAKRDMESNSHPRYIYFVGNTITANHTVPQGKTSYNQVTVLIDGVEYVRKDQKDKNNP